MLCFARLIRCAIVASGTRNALAISAVVRPPTARSVSAIADDGVSARMAAHEQQHQRVVALGDVDSLMRRRDDVWIGFRPRRRLRAAGAPSRCACDRSSAASAT